MNKKTPGKTRQDPIKTPLRAPQKIQEGVKNGNDQREQREIKSDPARETSKR
jgi:hypothetical protein